jgi:hypothetical protein
VAVLACVAALAVVAGPAGQASAQKRETAKSSLRQLVKQSGKLPKAAAPAAKRRALKRLALSARRFAKRKPCASIRALARFRGVIAGVRVKKKLRGKRRRAAQRLSALGPLSAETSRLLLAKRKTRRCGGGVKPPKGDNPRVSVLRSDEQRLRVRVQLPEVQFVAREAGGKAWTQLAVPNSDAPGAPGTPGIPVVSDVLAVPDGARLRVSVNDVDKIEMGGVDVFPVQPDPVDQATPPPNFLAGPFADRPFQLSERAYRRNALYPPRPADADALGAMRDLNIGALQIPTAQYNPAKRKLVLFRSVDVTVRFAGGPHTFTDELSNPWEHFQQRLGATLLNKNVLARGVREYYRRCGEEMMVITNPSTLVAANTFAAARRAAGIRTNVFQTGTGSGFIGTTAAEIQAFIRSRVNAFLCVRPSYVTIMGDDDLVPTFPGINGIPSDLQYSMRNDTDELPDVAVGRIIGNDQAAVATAVNKIISYENTPPGGPWLGRATLAAQFQDDDNNGQENRTFIQFAETVRNGLLRRGVAADRIYDDSPEADPKKFNDGTDLPAALRKPTFAWDGDGADVTAAWNEGRFLMIHRDHGWSDGWGHPGYSTTDVQALTNGAQLPVVMSINCSSGAYDYDETSFAGESLVNPNGGSVGVFGDTRDSPTWHNTQIGLGFVDALLPSVLPSEGPAEKQRVGDALIHGKLRLAGLAPPASDGNTRNELYLWHYFGDPTMQMWGGGRDPLRLDPALFDAVLVRSINGPLPPDPPPYWVQVTLPPEFNGQPFSLLRDGQVVGKGIAQNGTAIIPASFSDGSGRAGRLEVALDAQDAVPVRFPVRETETTLTQNCPADFEFHSNETVTITGRLNGAPAGSTVDVTWEMRDGQENLTRTVVTHPTTDGSGNWSTSVDSQSFEHGHWTVTARYAGAEGYSPSQAGVCTFEVEDNS